MTAFTTANLPLTTRAVTTLEELVMWAALALLDCNPTAKGVLNSGDSSTNFVQYRVGVDSDNKMRHQITVILYEKAGASTSNLPTWKGVSELSTTTLPTGFSG